MDKTFLVTGCSKGLGKAISKKLLHLGCTVIGISRSEVQLEGKFTHLKLDLTSGEDDVKNYLLKNKIALLSNVLALCGTKSFIWHWPSY